MKTAMSTVCRSVLVLLLVMPALALAAGQEAQIVLLMGQGEKSQGNTPDAWAAAAQGDSIPGGYWVRTLANSQMGIVVPERNQIRLNQNSLLQLKTAEESKEFAETKVKLAAGRAWSQARPRTPPRPTGAGGPATLAMETPSATMSIRGTDWEVEVGPDGRTQLVVLSGNVDIGNEFGAVNVATGEAAVAEVGKAPVKFVLVNPASRVQWVSSWWPQPRRWAGDDTRHAALIALIEAGRFDTALEQLRPLAGGDAVAAVLAADLLVQRGDVQAAADLLAPHAQDGHGDPRAVALLARAEARLDHPAVAAGLLDGALAAHPDAVELLLARGELAVLDGDAPGATALFERVVARDADNAEGWYGLGLIAAEREYVRLARERLDTALTKDPAFGKAAAERAAVDTFAGRLRAAEAAYDALLEKEPDNYVAWTGRGINRLKRGDADAALQDFLRAGLIEPRYARAWLYSGVAFYQKGERYRALQAFRHAEELDAHDPIPHMMASQAAADELDFGKAVAEARIAQQKMPYLKSLNQLANNQQGSANLGSPLAKLGLEEWANYYADEAYSPYWGGSHLFRADRYTGAFTKNSELMKGFLTDPLSFGASNRHASLVLEPGNYGRLDAEYLRDDYDQQVVTATANGLASGHVPLAYFVRGEGQWADSRENRTRGDEQSVVAGIGVRPLDNVSVFLFGTDKAIGSRVRDPAFLPDADLDQSESRGDIGFNIKVGPQNQVWLKMGDGSQRNRVDGDMFSPDLAGSLNRLFNVSFFVPDGALDINRTQIHGDDLQLRHAFSLGDARLAWGMETADQRQTLDFVTTWLAPALLNLPAKLDYLEDFAVASDAAYVSFAMPFTTAFEVQADLFYEDVRTERSLLNALHVHHDRLNIHLDLDLVDEAQRRSGAVLNPRVGFKWQFAGRQSLRGAWQQWRRGASFGSIAGIDTLGIPLNDRLPYAGGDYERVRVQFDGEFGARWYLQLFADHEEVDNGLAGKRTSLFSFQVRDLEKLRQREEFFKAPEDVEETPIFGEGSVDTLGAAASLALDAGVALSARYLWRDATQDGLLDGNRVPYLPRHFLRLGAEWDLPGQWLLGTHAVYRGKRFEDDRNADRVDAGWSFGIKAYWETPDKHHLVQAIIDNLAPDKDAMTENFRDPRYRLIYSYRF